ncbi:MAG: ABC transporter substrate-binding protein [Alphaproteobacteria bacterium]|jgi:peptide/nickel transport system substrate-binding protein|nr:ABC transporter substrate-binding protein [Alphaproteobacteria bacterium]
MHHHAGLAVAATVVALAAGGAHAQSLTIGAASEPSALDPHFHNLGPNNAMQRHLFDSLVLQDENQKLQPGLATAWEPTSETSWTFELREGVTFHDGASFEARDVVWTLCRIPNVADSPSSFEIYTKAIQRAEIQGPHTIVFHTAEPYPLLPVEVSTWAVLDAPEDARDLAYDPAGCDYAGEYPSTPAFNSGEAAIGTGPFMYGEFTKGERIVLERNPDYWGEAPDFEQVTFRPITSDGPRVAALLAGDVDFIDKPPLQDLPRLEDDPDLEVAQGLSNRVIYLHMDQYMDDTPGVSGVPANPFKDVRVREALSRAIDREAIVDRIMGGVAEPAGELLPPSMFGANPDAAPTEFDPDRARALLAEAGYGDGFELVLGTPNDRYINDELIAQAVAQMFARVGVDTTVDATTKSVFFSRRNDYEFSMYLAGWGSGTGEMSSPLRALVACRDPEAGYGGTNRGRYCNPEMDAVLKEALRTVDAEARRELLQAASSMVMADYGILPLHFEVTPWAFKQELGYTPRTDQYTLAMDVSLDRE